MLVLCPVLCGGASGGINRYLFRRLWGKSPRSTGARDWVMMAAQTFAV